MCPIFFRGSFCLMKVNGRLRGVAQLNFWTRSMRFNKMRPGGCLCERPYLRVPTYLRCMRPQVARCWRQVPSQASTCPWAHIGRLQVVARERSTFLFPHGASASSKQTVKRHMVHVRHNFAQKLNFKYRECHAANKI